MAATTAPLNLNSILSELASTFAPGGPAEVSGMQNIADQGKLLASQLGGSSALRGLGNTTTGIPVTVFKHVTKAQQDLRSNLMEHHSNILMSLANLMNQQQNQQRQFGLQSGELGLKQLQYNDARQAARNSAAPAAPAAPTASNSGYDLNIPPSLFGGTDQRTGTSVSAPATTLSNGGGSFNGSMLAPGSSLNTVSDFGAQSRANQAAFEAKNNTLFDLPIETLMNMSIAPPENESPDLYNMSLEDLMNLNVEPYDGQ